MSYGSDIDYTVNGDAIIQIHNLGKPFEERMEVARCHEPQKAIKLIKRARWLNDVKRKYTESARTFAKVEELPGFQWIEA